MEDGDAKKWVREKTSCFSEKRSRRVYVRSIRKKPSSIPALNYNGRLFTSNSSKANVLNEYFSECFNTSSPPFPLQPPVADCPPCPSDLLCTKDQLISLISNLPFITASGPNQISSCMLKLISPAITAPLTIIFNLSLTHGHIPTEWKSSFVIPIPKVPNPNSPAEFRPISLLSIISKLLEKHIHSILYNHCFERNLISPFQFGFLPARSINFYCSPVCHSLLLYLSPD